MAREAGLTTFAFRNISALPSPAAAFFIHNAGTDWQRYQTPQEFIHRFERLLISRLIEGTPGYGLSLSDIEELTQRLRALDEVESNSPSDERRGAGRGGVILPADRSLAALNSTGRAGGIAARPVSFLVPPASRRASCGKAHLGQVGPAAAAALRGQVPRARPSISVPTINCAPCRAQQRRVKVQVQVPLVWGWPAVGFWCWPRCGKRTSNRFRSEWSAAG